LNKLISWAKEHPTEATIGGLVAGLAVLYFMGFFSGGGQAQAGADNASAYYAAQAAQTQSGNAVQIAQIEAQSGTAQDLIAANANVQNSQIWSQVGLQETQANDQASMSMAPFQTEAQYISTLGQIASLPPLVSSSSSSGFLGIGAGSKTTSTPNPNAMAAAANLNNLSNGFFNT